ncbi:MAG: hypothetical protein HYU58_12530 [Proteobacteria bacterium]|nr:hypothetical protein [Pseudomonadota bacterium]
MRLHQPIALAALITLLLGCSQVPMPQATSTTYRIGETDFVFADDVVLQTWPVIAKQTPLHFARVALQMTPQALSPDLPSKGRIQIDVLAPQQSPRPAGILAANFTDWAGRETAPAGSNYLYDPHSKLLPDGGRSHYRSALAPAGLVALEPASGTDASPRFFLHLDGGVVDRVIECRSDVPPSKNVGEYCALRPEAGADFGYRIFFPRALLPEWQALDAATRAYISAARR